MRAAQAAVRRRPMLHAAPPSPLATREQRTPRVVFGFAAAFLLGYLPGIWASRSGQTALGQQLAAYYMQQDGAAGWAAAFLAQYAVAFLQLTGLFLCAFCAFGGGFCVLLLAARGGYLGFCAANIVVAGGTSELLRWRLLCALPELSDLFLCLWLAVYALPVSAGLFQSAFRGGAPRGQLPAGVRRLGVRYAVALVSAALFSLVSVGVGFAVIRLSGR